jgi:hypothetical protein
MLDDLHESIDKNSASSAARQERKHVAPDANGKRSNETGGDETAPPFSAAALDLIRSALKPEQADEDRSFTLTGLFALITFVAVVLALGNYLPKPIFAGVTGLATLVGMVALSLIKGPPMVIQLGWWLLLSIYLLAIGWAVWG